MNLDNLSVEVLTAILAVITVVGLAIFFAILIAANRAAEKRQWRR